MSDPEATSTASLLARITQTGIPDGADALRAVVGALSERLLGDEARALAAHLPPTLAKVVEEREHGRDSSAEELYAQVHRALPNTSHGTAREHAEVVLRILGEHLPNEVRARLIRALPEELGRHLVAPRFDTPAPHGVAAHAPAMSTLASGRPGSRHPLAEAAPEGGHAHSVATNPDPHGKTKLSSAHGLTQERLDESLATGRPPGTDHSIASSGDS